MSRRTKAAVAALFLAAGLVVALVGTHMVAATATSRPHTQVPVQPPGLTLAAPLSPARLTAGEAEGILEKSFEPSLFQHPFTAEYGAFNDPGLSIKVGPTMTRVGTADVWKFTITGLNLRRPCGVMGNCAPPAHTLVLIVEDKTGTFLEGDEY